MLRILTFGPESYGRWTGKVIWDSVTNRYTCYPDWPKMTQGSSGVCPEAKVDANIKCGWWVEEKVDPDLVLAEGL